MNQKGKHIITDELTLTDFTWEIRSLLWWYDQDFITIEVTFNNNQESRSFDYHTSRASFTKKHCKNYLLTLPQFKGSQ